MGKLHELLAAEKTVVDASKKIISETNLKFQKVEQYFQGNVKTLQMTKDDPAKDAIEKAGSTKKELATTVIATLGYALDLWARAEDSLFQKNKSNQRAIADINFRGKTIATDIPVDELMGLEARLAELRRTMELIPTLDASVSWKKKEDAAEDGTWEAVSPIVSTKTEKIITFVTATKATDKFPETVKEVSKDEVVGSFSELKFSGAATSRQKAEVLSIIDDLISEVKQARCRANNIEAETVKIGNTLVEVILSPFKE